MKTQHIKRPDFASSHSGHSVKQTDKPQTKTFGLTRDKQKMLKIIPLGGLGEVGRNMTLFEFEGKFLIVDVGFRIPGEDMPGIDYLIPNTRYLKERKDKILGAVITHGHYDHIGAIPYCWGRLGNPPIFTGKLAKGIILKRQQEFPHKNNLDITEIKDGSKITLGPFKIEFFKQNHNIPDNFGLLIKTPIGNIVHTSDFKFDKAPVNGSPTDFKQLKAIAGNRVLALMCDSTGAENEGNSLSERVIFENLEEIFKQARGRIISSTFASHLNRIQQLVALAEKYQRKVMVGGFSLKSTLEIAQNLKYITAKKGTIIKQPQAGKYPDNKLSLICTGAQGEEGATLMRIANGEHKYINLKKGDTVIFSSSVIPGNERTVQFLKDEFYRQGAHVFHYQMMDIHASGHGYQEEIKKMIKIMRPKYFIPLHGQYSMLVKAAELAQEAGVKKNNVLVAENGDIVKVDQASISKAKETAPANYVMVDGLGIGDVGEVVLRDRQNLAEDGMFVIVVAVDRQAGKVKGSPDIISRGFVYLRESKDLLQETRKRVIDIVHKSVKPGTAVNWNYLKNEIRNKVSEYLFYKTQRRPMVLPVVIEV